MSIKTHLVLDKVYTVEEGQETYAGSHKECLDFVSTQNSFGLVIVPMTEEELKIHN